uniref:Glycoside hydrolase family 3 N-terminal domain-containing protein n=1 Tax=Eutreptiella gymnastica TaxID=73025 RepID=A0A7S1NG40_9EUGL
MSVYMLRPRFGSAPSPSRARHGTEMPPVDLDAADQAQAAAANELETKGAGRVEETAQAAGRLHPLAAKYFDADARLYAMVARMFVVGKPHAGGKWNEEWADTLAKGVGGIIIAKENYGFSPRKLWNLTSALKNHANRSLAIFADQEGGWRGKYRHGQAFREGFTPLPKMGTVGNKLKNDSFLQHQVAKEVSATKFRELRAVNIDLNFDPVMDVNSNPSNPVIGDRAISGNVSRVASLGAAMISAGQAQSVGAVAKHFPGHGDTTTDSHLELPQVHKSLDALWKVELKPFAAAVRANVSGIMTAHILYPKVDPGKPATMSSVFIHDILRTQLGYDGIVFSDSLDMKAVMNNQWSVGDVIVQAVNAGVDMLVTSNKRTDNFEDRAIVALMDAVKARSVPQERIMEANRRIDRLFAGYVRPATERFEFHPDLNKKWFVPPPTE